MKFTLILITAALISQLSYAQETFELSHNQIPEIEWQTGEKAYYSKDWDNPVVTNVSVPTIQIFRPEKPNGVAVVIAPGGGLYALSIESEGTQVAEWLANQGITAFVLKYRLVPTGEDGVKDLAVDGQSINNLVKKKVAKVLPYSINDALEAIKFARNHADEYSLDTHKIGVMGFSAGGAVAMGTVYNYNQASRPDFLVPVYAWTEVFDVKEPPTDAPPIFVVCSSDDPLGLANGSVDIYKAWLNAGKSASLQMYAQGGHGYGMKMQGLPSDNWIQRFHEWLQGQGFFN